MTTHLEDIRTFLGKVHTVATVKHVGEHGTNLDSIVDATFQRILVFPGELIGTNGNFYIERYLVQLSETNETTLTTAINNIFDGIEKFNKRAAIAGWVYASYSTMCHIELANGKQSFKNFSTKRWYKDIMLDFTWSTS